MLGGLINAQIKTEEVQGMVEEMKAGKAAGLDGCAVKYLKSGGRSVIERLLKLLNVFCDQYVWTQGENGRGPVGEENSKIQCERCEVERKATNRMDGWNEKSIK